MDNKAYYLKSEELIRVSLMDFLKTHGRKDEVVNEVIKESVKQNRKFKKEPLSSKELNDLSMQMFRVKAISKMVKSATDVFIKNSPKMIDGSIEKGFTLIEKSNCAKLCEIVEDFDREHGFKHKEVLKLELEGNNYIKSLMSMLWKAISSEGDPGSPFERYAFGGISENYRRVYQDSEKIFYDKCQLLCDAISGMTESYLIKKHDELKLLENAFS